MRIINFGSLNLDYTYSVDHIVEPGETQDTKERKIFCGGKGLNQSIALARAGMDVHHAGMIGEDGEMLVNLCRQENIHTHYIWKVAGPSGHTIIQVDETGQNSILLYGGANRKFSKNYIDEVLADFGEDDIVLLQNEINLVDYVIEAAGRLCLSGRTETVLSGQPACAREEYNGSRGYFYRILSRFPCFGDGCAGVPDGCHQGGGYSGHKRGGGRLHPNETGSTGD